MSADRYAGLWTEQLQERRPLGRPRHRWERDTETGLKGIEWNSVFWIHYICDGEQGDSCEQGTGPSGVHHHSFSILCDDRFKASSKTIPPHSAI